MRKGWTKIHNNLSEYGLSLEEYGLIVYLKTNEDYFKVSPTHIAKKFKKDIRSVNKILEKLSEMGYIKLVLNNTCKSTIVEINTGVNQHLEVVEINTGDSVNQHLKLVEINTTRRKKTIEKNKKKEKSIKKENTALSVQKIKNENHKSVNSKMNALEIFKVQAIANKEKLLAMPEIEGNEELLRRYYGYFTDYLKNRKKPYKDYVAAFRISIRADWANLKRYKAEKSTPKTFKELESERIKKNLEKFGKGGQSGRPELGKLNILVS